MPHLLVYPIPRGGVNPARQAGCSAQLLPEFSHVARVGFGRPEPRRLDVEQRMSRRKPLGDVVAAGAVFSEPVVAEIDDGQEAVVHQRPTNSSTVAKASPRAFRSRMRSRSASTVCG